MATALKTSSQISGLLKQLLTLMYIPAEHAIDVLCYIEAQCTDENFLNLVAYMPRGLGYGSQRTGHSS